MTIDMELIKGLSIVIGFIAGAIGLGKTIISPIKARLKAQDEQDKKVYDAFNKKLDGIQGSVVEQAKAITAMQHERLTSVKAIYTQLGHCPPEEKAAIKGVYDHYRQGGNNHLVTSYLDEIERLPSYPKEPLPGKGGLKV